jgi:hypothetical protein
MKFNYYKLVIPAIVILVIAGIASFILAYNFYPQKHVNINIGGRCYEFLDAAFTRYQDLVSQKEIEILKLQLAAIDSPEAMIPITFSGTEQDIKDFTQKYSIKITSDKIISQNNAEDVHIIGALIKKKDFQNAVNSLTLQDVNPLSKSTAGSIGIQPNPQITSQEGMQISATTNSFMKKGIQDIIDSKDGVKPAECRSKIQY